MKPKTWTIKHSSNYLGINWATKVYRTILWRGRGKYGQTWQIDKVVEAKGETYLSLTEERGLKNSHLA